MRWLYSTEGSVSMYFMMILGALFLFGSVFVDFARVRTAELRHQSAVHAAARSVHSSFDTELQRYGLYGLHAGSASQVFEDVLLRNLASPGVMNERGNWIELEPDPTSISMNYANTLAEHPILKQQILEEMKYRAPIEYMFGIYDKLRTTPVLEMVQESNVLTGKLESLEALIEKREQALNSAWREITLLAGSNGYVPFAYEQNQASLSQIEQLAEQLKSETVASLEQASRELEATIERIISNLTQVNERLEDAEKIEDDLVRNQEKSMLEQERSGLEQELSEKRTALGRVQSLLQIAIRFVAEVGKHQLSIQMHSMELERRMERIKQDLNEARDWNEQLIEEINSLDEEFHDAVPLLNPAYIDQRITGVGVIVSLHYGYVRHFDMLQILSGDDFKANQAQLNRMNQAFALEATRLFQQHEPEEQRRQELRQIATQQQDEARDRAKGILGDVIHGLTNCTAGSEMTFTRLSEYEERYLTLNKGLQEMEEERTDLDSDPERTASKARSLMERIQGAVLAIRDGVYLNEYALTKFNYRTLADQSYERSEPHNHLLARQEAEYILYGFPSCYLNQSAAYGEIYMVRLAIRITEQLAQPKRSILAIGSPWLVFLVALADGAYQAYQDVQRLVDGEEVEISNLLAKQLTMNYKDYLRLFMLLHGREASMMARMQALVQLNTGVDLAERSTSAELSSSSRMKLWFIPEAARILGRTVEQGQLLVHTDTMVTY